MVYAIIEIEHDTYDDVKAVYTEDLIQAVHYLKDKYNSYDLEGLETNENVMDLEDDEVEFEFEFSNNQFYIELKSDEWWLEFYIVIPKILK